MTAEVDYRGKIRELIKAFKSMPTYKDGSVTTKDFPALIKAIEFGRTDEQIQTYVDYWDKKHGGVLTTEDYLGIATALYRTSEFARQFAISVDHDKDGFISSKEFLEIADVVSIHDPKFVGKSYDDFVSEADTNCDGKVSIEECAVWVESKVNKSVE